MTVSGADGYLVAGLGYLAQIFILLTLGTASFNNDKFSPGQGVWCVRQTVSTVCSIIRLPPFVRLCVATIVDLGMILSHLNQCEGWSCDGTLWKASCATNRRVYVFQLAQGYSPIFARLRVLRQTSRLKYTEPR